MRKLFRIPAYAGMSGVFFMRLKPPPSPP
jgi:hypothetical protein